jgi:hypothetical protein
VSEAMKRIERLWNEARNCKNPRRLREIARQMRELGQWLDARWADNKAFDLEKKQAEAA